MNRGDAKNVRKKQKKKIANNRVDGTWHRHDRLSINISIYYIYIDVNKSKANQSAFV